MDIQQLQAKLEEIKKQIDPQDVFSPADYFLKENGWMIKLKNNNDPLFEKIVYEDITLTSNFFKTDYATVNDLLFGSVFDYNKEQAPIVILFYLYLRQKMLEGCQ